MWPGQISLDLFRDLQVERSNLQSVWPSSVDGDLSNCINWAIAIMRSCYFADRDVRHRINSPIAIYAIVLFRRSQFTRSCYFAGRDSTRSCYFADHVLRDHVIFSWSRVRTPAKQYHLFYWSWVRFPGQIACFRPVWFMAYVTRPHKWWIRVMGKKPHGREKKCKVTVLSVRLWWRGRLSLVGILIFKIRCYSPNV